MSSVLFVRVSGLMASLKKPSAALRCNFMRLACRGELRSPIFGRPQDAPTIEAIVPLTFYEIIRVESGPPLEFFPPCQKSGDTCGILITSGRKRKGPVPIAGTGPCGFLPFLPQNMGTDWPPITMMTLMTKIPMITSAAEAYWTAGIIRVFGWANKRQGQKRTQHEFNPQEPDGVFSRGQQLQHGVGFGVRGGQHGEVAADQEEVGDDKDDQKSRSRVPIDPFMLFHLHLGHLGGISAQTEIAQRR